MSRKLKKILDITFWKFLIVGFANTIVGTMVMFTAYNIFCLNYWISSAMNYIVGSILSYFLNKYFTFNNRQKSCRQIIAFILNISICYMISYGIAKPLALLALSGQSKYIQDNAAMLFGMCVFVFINYLGQRFVVFNRVDRDND